MGATSVLPQRTDHVRIVPLQQGPPVETIDRVVAPTAAPHLTYHRGALLGSVEVFTIYWGAAWARGQRKALASELNAFFDAILASALLDQLGEYGSSAVPIGHGRRTGSVTLRTPKIAGSTSDGAIQHLLQQEIATNPSVPQPTPDTLYFVYLPPGVSVAQGGARSCQAFCGYHNDIAGRIFYAVMPYPGCSGCTGGLSTLDALTSTSSHELCEAITDPVPGQGWYDDANNAEIGDLCSWKTKTVGGATVQLEWSNAQSACV